MRPKRKAEAQIIGDEAVAVLRMLLPRHFTLREYHPDFGLDLAVELFDDPRADLNGYITSDALGEHIFFQVKGMESVELHALALSPRLNVEKYASSTHNLSDGVDPVSINTIAFQLETPELITVQRMGSTVPVLLVLVDVKSRRAFFVCLNDYIDKIILPTDPEYGQKKSKVVHVPEKNEIIDTPTALVPLRFYGKRAKLMAAFQKFAYQKNELDYTSDADLVSVARHFAQVNLRYDFWTSSDFWFAITHAHRGLANFLRDGHPGQTWRSPDVAERTQKEGSVWTNDEMTSFTLSEALDLQDIRTLWSQLANLGRIYEEICREWFLPTYLGITSSY